MALKIVLLEKKYEKTKFSCGYELLDNYIKKQAKQDVNRDLSACYVLLEDDDIIKGYYTLSANSIKREEFEDDLIKKLPPSYVEIPTILLGRLAIDQSIKGKRLGEALLLDALKTSLQISKNMGILAVVVDPIDEKAIGFYTQYGFILLPTSGKMFLPMKTIKDLFKDI
ncbi:GNAT family N-acetyltransferase [Paenimyroides aestuarii]|uniref:GNAT family N-acetyltransferase n=1 Tax=Paenimyroides aestuarii TaxID=2968490 RepID=A0ABY5NRA7_9FLAO|nr:GNAT family N-acetyltransferase [Paenimyroides aestuarii]UUV21097.1 GNAT family N-acetyltransferase [Paenimyroides aestuarii]